MAQGSDTAGSTDAVAAAHRRLLQDSSLQFDFAQPQPPPRTPDWLHPLGEFLKAIAPAMSWIFWGALIVGALCLAYFVGREMVGRYWARRPKAPKPVVATSPWRPEAHQAMTLLSDADRLAAEGRYAEAAHLLLLRTIDDIRGRRPDLVRPALTSRELGALEALPASARPAFRAIAQVVERSLFGGATVAADDFARCRADYEAFALPKAWS